MSMPISTQREQYQAFADDAGVYARRDPVTAVYDVDDFGPELLAGPQIHAGLNNPRAYREANDHGFYGRPGPLNPPSVYQEDPPESDGYDPRQDFYNDPDPQHENYDAYSQEPSTPLQPLDQMLEHSYRPDPQEPPPSFSVARRRTADGGPGNATEDLNGTTSQYFTPNLYSPADRVRWESQATGGDTHWPTAATVLPAQPQAPVQPTWLGHTYAPGHRVGMPWRDGDIPGTVTHLDGTDVGVRWDDGQHSIEQPGDIRPLY